MPDRPPACVCCGNSQLRSVDPYFPLWQPYKGTVFSTYGQYGSTVYDAEHRQLIIIVCDDCLLKKAAAGQVLQQTLPACVHQHETVVIWEGPRSSEEEEGDSHVG